MGKLSGGHQAAVMVLAVDDTDTADGNICVVTGSKDHYIKVSTKGFYTFVANFASNSHQSYNSAITCRGI